MDEVSIGASFLCGRGKQFPHAASRLPVASRPFSGGRLGVLRLLYRVSPPLVLVAGNFMFPRPSPALTPIRLVPLGDLQPTGSALAQYQMVAARSVFRKGPVLRMGEFNLPHPLSALPCLVLPLALPCFPMMDQLWSRMAMSYRISEILRPIYFRLCLAEQSSTK